MSKYNPDLEKFKKEYEELLKEYENLRALRGSKTSQSSLLCESSDSWGDKGLNDFLRTAGRWDRVPVDIHERAIKK